MRNRAISPVATILSVLVLAFVAIPAQAGPVAYSDVVHVMGNLRSGGQSQELRLRSISQEGTTPVNGALVSASKSATDASSSATTSEPTSLVSTTQEGQQGSVEVIQEGDVTGTVCDCGEFIIPGGGFPKWLVLGGVPLVCVLVDCTPDDEPECEGPDCNPCVNCTTVPEPATIFLLGSGLAALGAKARRRYGRRTDTEVPTDTEEV
jgi:hypothetical protein